MDKGPMAEADEEEGQGSWYGGNGCREVDTDPTPPAQCPQKRILPYSVSQQETMDDGQGGQDWGWSMQG